MEGSIKEKREERLEKRVGREGKGENELKK
jgi:hypothetical protein